MSVRRWMWAAVAGLILVGSVPRQAFAAVDPAPDPASAKSERPKSDFEYEVEFDVASDYVFRGIDQTNRQPAGFLDASVSWKSAYVGVSTSNINYRPFGDRRTNQEVDAYAGYKDEAFGFGYDVGVISYNYINQPGGLNYVEGYGRLSREIGPVRLGLELNFKPDTTRPRRGDFYGEGQASWQLTRRWTVAGAVGRGSGQSNYLNWNIGLAYALTRKVSLDLRYSDTDAHSLGPAYDGRVIASVKVRFQ